MKTAKKSTPKPKKTPVTKKPKSSKGGPRNIDWYEVRKAYLTDNNLTYEDLAKTYKVSKTTIGNKALAENWTQLRQDLNEQAFAILLRSYSILRAKHRVGIYSIGRTYRLSLIRRL